MASKSPECIIIPPRNSPRDSAGTRKPWVTTVTMIMAMLTRARPLALASFAMSRYKDRGYETPKMSTMMMARRFVNSQRKDISASEGKRASRTRGIVSPTMTEKATIPPNAL